MYLCIYTLTTSVLQAPKYRTTRFHLGTFRTILFYQCSTIGSSLYRYIYYVVLVFVVGLNGKRPTTSLCFYGAVHRRDLGEHPRCSNNAGERPSNGKENELNSLADRRESE